MARLNDPPHSENDSLETIKKRFIRQNREIARVNSTQSIRIRSLESETTRLLSENIELREQVIKLQASLDKRERSKVVLENVETTKKQLEEKVAEMQALVNGLGQVVSFSPQVKAPPKQKAYIVSPEQRTWKSGLSFSEVMGTEGSLPAISEDARSRRSSLNVDEHRRTSLNGNESRRSSLNTDENRRNSINFEEITLLPTPQIDDAESDEDLKPPTSSLLDIRPRRRRDSALPVNLESSKSAVPSKAQSQTTADSANVPVKPRKRRYEDRDQAQDIEPQVALDFKFTKLSQKTADTKQPVEIQKPPVALVILDEPEDETVAMNKEELNEIEEIVEAGRRAIRFDPVEPREFIPTRETVTSSAAPTMGRRALGPKSTNSDPSNSPLKQTAIRSHILREGDLEKLEFNAPPKIKAYGSKPRDIDVLPTDIDTGASRPSRRTKASVNYALPNLRDKMRRDDRPGEPLKEGKTSRRATSGGQLRNRNSVEELMMKQEEYEVEGIVGNQWFDLPNLPNTSLAVDAGEESRKVKDTGIGGLLERNSSREDELEQGLPASVMTHRKRRSSNLHQSSLTDILQDGTSGRRSDMSQITVPTESRRKTVSFDPANTTSNEGGQSRNRSESANLKRKQMVHSHLPPSSSHIDVGKASAALSESVRASRRITLGGAAKGIRNARSNSDLVGDDEIEVDDSISTNALGMASRRRSMML